VTCPSILQSSGYFTNVVFHPVERFLDGITQVLYHKLPEASMAHDPLTIPRPDNEPVVYNPDGALLSTASPSTEATIVIGFHVEASVLRDSIASSEVIYPYVYDVAQAGTFHGT